MEGAMQSIAVRALMSSPVITITPQTRLPQIKNILRENNIRRVPVVAQDRLVGIVTLGDVRNAFPSDATTLSIYELSDLLAKVTATDVMRTAVIGINADAPLVEAARLMLTQKISGLPVLEDGRLVGMITESDIFRAVISGSLPLPTATAVVTRERRIIAKMPIV